MSIRRIELGRVHSLLVAVPVVSKIGLAERLFGLTDARVGDLSSRLIREWSRRFLDERRENAGGPPEKEYPAIVFAAKVDMWMGNRGSNFVRGWGMRRGRVGQRMGFSAY